MEEILIKNCVKCDTALRSGTFECHNCNYDNTFENLALINSRDKTRKDEANNQGFETWEKYQQHKVDVESERRAEERRKVERIRINDRNEVLKGVFAKLSVWVLSPAFSLGITYVIVPNWWFIFKLIPAVIIFVILSAILASILDDYL